MRKRSPRTVEELRNALLRVSPEDEAGNDRAYMRVMVANFMQDLRVSAGLTQIQLADAARMTQSEVSRLERAAGTRAPELYTLIRVMRACGYDLSLLATPRQSRKGRTRKAALLTRPKDRL